MKIIRFAALALLGATLIAAPASAGTDLETTQRKLSRIATYSAFGQSPKKFCQCQDGSSHHAEVGKMIQSTTGSTQVHIVASCLIQGFTAAGDQLSGGYSCYTFVPLN